MNKTEITWSAFIWNRVESSRGRIVGLKLMLRTRIWERVGVLAVSTITNLEPAMLLASSRPHDHFSIKVMATRIILWG